MGRIIPLNEGKKKIETPRGQEVQAEVKVMIMGDGSLQVASNIENKLMVIGLLEVAKEVVLSEESEGIG